GQRLRGRGAEHVLVNAHCFRKRFVRSGCIRLSFQKQAKVSRSLSRTGVVGTEFVLPPREGILEDLPKHRLVRLQRQRGDKTKNHTSSEESGSVPKTKGYG